MINHYILIAFRNISRHKSSFFINLLGLSTGLACTILIFLWVSDERGMDKFHVNDAQLYQVMEVSKENDKIFVKPHTQGLLAETMAKDLPEIERATTFFSLVNEGYTINFKTDDGKVTKAGGVWADQEFFNMFSYKLNSGLPNEVLKDKNAVVISSSLAKAMYKAGEDPIGKRIEWEALGRKYTAQVSGIMADVPDQSTQKFDFVMTKESLFEFVPNFTKWYNEGTNTFLQLKAGTNVDAFNAKIKDFLKTYHKDNLFSLFVRPYSSGYLYGKYENGVLAGGRIGYVRLFSLIAFFILLIACINFMNLSTAKASRRQKEVGIKKAVGSTRVALIGQFLAESVMISIFSLLAAVVMVQLFLPPFNEITGKDLSLHLNTNNLLLLTGATVFTGLVSGSYPALYLSGFNVISIFKGKLKNSLGELLARKGLVVFQFAVSLLLIIAVAVIYQQMKLIQNMNLGYDKDNVVYFDREANLVENASSFLQKLRMLPGVIHASALNGGVASSKDNSTTYGISWPGKPANNVTNFSDRSVDIGLLETLNIEMKEGRSFSEKFGADSNKLIFNETAIKAMNLQDPIGTPITMWNKSYTIVGVVKDFHLQSIHEVIPPMVFRYAPEETSQFMVKIKSGSEKNTLAQIENLYKEYNAGYPFNYAFLDERYQALYLAEQRVSTLSKYFAGLAILISCLGLFGLATFNAEIRAKEMSIRKVLGASISSVVYLLSKDFMKLALIAVIIAFPLGWWAMNKWLEGFVYKVEIGPYIFIISFALILVITMVTVGYQAVKAAIANPIQALRTE